MSRDPRDAATKNVGSTDCLTEARRYEQKFLLRSTRDLFPHDWQEMVIPFVAIFPGGRPLDSSQFGSGESHLPVEPHDSDESLWRSDAASQHYAGD